MRSMSVLAARAEQTRHPRIAEACLATFVGMTVGRDVPGSCRDFPLVIPAEAQRRAGTQGHKRDGSRVSQDGLARDDNFACRGTRRSPLIPSSRRNKCAGGRLAERESPAPQMTTTLAARSRNAASHHARHFVSSGWR
ncbi:hypothetical protein SAMN04488557_2650 [Hyphomicrobium facile]|uniref:Uncharacterized protein n=1 Tax=Hyphomicrobium facile TaxID=51670 RepID=A0A1I7NQ02_9HYPH|nr:hypothetical protein SAMN04488557_2650 [Hyphomicrobium facile]